MKMRLKRVEENQHGTFGVLSREDGGQYIPFAVTLELPWLNNQQEKSCIPPGLYKCRRTDSPRFGNTFEITGVKDRTKVLFHRGNWIKDLRGCVAVAEQYEVLDGKPAVAQSGKGFEEFLNHASAFQEFDLELIDDTK